MSKRSPESQFEREVEQSIAGCFYRPYGSNAVVPLIRKLHGNVAQLNLPDSIVCHAGHVYFVEYKLCRRVFGKYDKKTNRVVGQFNFLNDLTGGQRATIQQLVNNGINCVVVVGLEKYNRAVAINLLAASKLLPGGARLIPETITGVVSIERPDPFGDPLDADVCFTWGSFKPLSAIVILKRESKGRWSNAARILEAAK